MSGAIASADTGGDSSTVSNAGSTLSGTGTSGTADLGTTSSGVSTTSASTSNTAADASGDASTGTGGSPTSAGGSAAADAGHTVTITSGGTPGDDRPVTTVSAQTNSSTIKPQVSDTAPTVSAEASTATMSAPVDPATTATAATAAASEPVAPASSNSQSAPQTTSAAEAAATVGSPAAAAAPPQTTTPVETPATPPSTAAALVDAAKVAPPDVREVVAYLLKVLATAAVDALHSVIQLVEGIRSALGLPWPSEHIGNEHFPPSVFDSADPSDDVALAGLKQTLARSLLPEVTLSTVGTALAAGFTLNEIVSLTETLESAAPVLAEAWQSEGTGFTPTKQAVTALVTMSLWALLSSALPGLSGMFAAAVAGVRIGYRQAKARMVLHSMELVRFVRPGPLGVVRSASLINVHSHPSALEGASERPHLRVAS
ncbi:hypothetical protein KL953_10185 [Mycolicibacterium goodii]|uniref:hypothetical protein n=1 Tax=Mycolicibacterium goodii TaxID=134601 RepID=UPI001BDC6AD5|nr:hypothetical protein [Mycolicibacterium goodii]MBU8809263.1 hypothetical protein [Mycolicibacterium goodii]